MKRLIGVMAMVTGLGLTVSAGAQSKTPTVSPVLHNSNFKTAPVNQHFSNNTNMQSEVGDPGLHSVNIHVRQILKQIQTDLKANKISQIQANDLRRKVQSVWIQAVMWFHVPRTLTDDQTTKLNDKLDAIASEL